MNNGKIKKGVKSKSGAAAAGYKKGRLPQKNLF